MSARFFLTPAVLICALLMGGPLGPIGAQADPTFEGDCAVCSACATCVDCVPQCNTCQPCFGQPSDTPGCEACEPCVACQQCYDIGCGDCETCLDGTGAGDGADAGVATSDDSSDIPAGDVCGPCEPCKKCANCVPNCTPCKPCFALTSPANPSMADTPGCEQCEACDNCATCFGFCGLDDTCDPTGCEDCEPCMAADEVGGNHDGFDLDLPPLNPQESEDMTPSSALQDGAYIDGKGSSEGFNENDFPALNSPYSGDGGGETWGLSASIGNGSSMSYGFAFSMLGMAALVVAVVNANWSKFGMGKAPHAAASSNEATLLKSDYGTNAAGFQERL